MFIHTRSSAPKRFAKLRWQTRTFWPQTVEKEVAKHYSSVSPLHSAGPSITSLYTVAEKLTL